MYIVLYYVLPLLILLRVLNYFRIRNLTLRTEYKLQALKNDLRFMAIEEKVHPSDPMFKYLDTVLGHASIYIKEVNFWVLLYLIRKHKTDNAIQIAEITEKSFNNTTELKKIYDNYGSTLLRYFVEKSKWSLKIYKAVVKMIFFIKKLLKKPPKNNFFNDMIRQFRYLLMNSSGIHRYC